MTQEPDEPGQGADALGDELEPTREDLLNAGFRCAVFMRDQLRAEVASVDSAAARAYEAWRTRTRHELIALYQDEAPSMLLSRAEEAGLEVETLRGLAAAPLLAAVIERALGGMAMEAEAEQLNRSHRCATCGRTYERVEFSRRGGSLTRFTERLTCNLAPDCHNCRPRLPVMQQGPR